MLVEVTKNYTLNDELYTQLQFNQKITQINTCGRYVSCYFLYLLAPFESFRQHQNVFMESIHQRLTLVLFIENRVRIHFYRKIGNSSSMLLFATSYDKVTMQNIITFYQVLLNLCLLCRKKQINQLIMKINISKIVRCFCMCFLIISIIIYNLA